jgi:hypothetical protein
MSTTQCSGCTSTGPCKGSHKGPKAHYLDTIGNKCTDRTVTERKMIKRAKRKAITQSIVIPVIRHVRDKGRSATFVGDREYFRSWEKRYQETLNCESVLIQRGKSLHHYHCRHRWCAVCNGVQAGKNLASYGKQIESMQDPYFVTLTTRNCTSDQLNDTLDRFQDAWRSICKSVRSKSKLVAFKKMEFTYKEKKDTWNPHYHIIVDGKEQSQMILDLWMKIWGDEVDLKGQDVKRVSDRDGAIREVFKYTHKGYQDGKLIPPDALFVLHQALHKRRLFSAVGMVKEKHVEDVEDHSTVDWRVEEDTVWVWQPYVCNWVNPSGELFIEYDFTTKEKRLLNINTS